MDVKSGMTTMKCRMTVPSAISNANKLVTTPDGPVRSGKRSRDHDHETAQNSGMLRPDFTFDALAQLARAGAHTAPDVCHRSIAFLLDGSRAEAVRHPLPIVPLAPHQVYEVLVRLNGNSRIRCRCDGPVTTRPRIPAITTDSHSRRLFEAIVPKILGGAPTFWGDLSSSVMR